MPLDLDLIERLLGEATPGPWRFLQTGIDYGYVGRDGETTVLFGEQSEGAVEENDPDALALVALRNAAPELLALARRGQASGALPVDDAADLRMEELRASQPRESQAPASPSADELAEALADVVLAWNSDPEGCVEGDIIERARALLARRRK